jgi:TfoX/Sxy family transcriptional regulator of competence genes
MASTQKFLEFVLDQIHDAGEITSRKMFGEYAIYADGKVVALVADNKLFVKQTEGGKKFIGDYQEAPAYPGAKMSFLIEDQIEDHQFLSDLFRITAAEVPFPKPKKSKKKK